MFDGISYNGENTDAHLLAFVNSFYFLRTTIGGERCSRRFNRSRAARLLGITRSQLYSRIQKHGLGEGSAGPRG